MEIILEGMEFHAFHGVMDEERKIGGKYVVNLYVSVPDGSGADDSIDSTVNYQSLYDITKNVLSSNENVNLIEYLAHCVIHDIYENFTNITNVKIQLYKYNPPVGGKVERAGICLCK